MTVRTILNCDGRINGRPCRWTTSDNFASPNIKEDQYRAEGWRFTLDGKDYCPLCARYIAQQGGWPMPLFPADPCAYSASCKGGPLTAVFGHEDVSHRLISALRRNHIHTLDAARRLTEIDITDLRGVGQRMAALLRCALYGAPPPCVFSTTTGMSKAPCPHCPKGSELPRYLGHYPLSHKISSSLSRNGITTMRALADLYDNASETLRAIPVVGERTLPIIAEAIRKYRDTAP